MSGGESRAAPSRRPYLLRAMHEWMGDAGFTPHIVVDAARAGVQVPAAFVKDDRVVLNVSMAATQGLSLGNEAIDFDARFAGVVHHVHVPVGAVLGIYARETGEGLVFNEDGGPDLPPAGESGKDAVAESAESRRSRFKVVK